jgi:hypothetical protein
MIQCDRADRAALLRPACSPEIMATATQHLVFDSKLTTYDGLDRLDAAGITFITLRRRSQSLLAEIDHLPPSAWRTVNLEISSRKHRH